MSIRQQLEDGLKPYLPDTWRVTAYERDIDRPDRPTFMLRQKRYRYDQSIGRLVAVFKLTLISPHEDDKKAEDALDTEVGDVLDAIVSQLDAVRILAAEKARFGKAGYASWDIDIETPMERKI